LYFASKIYAVVVSLSANSIFFVSNFRYSRYSFEDPTLLRSEKSFEVTGFEIS
jgi:hypothetical protein